MTTPLVCWLHFCARRRSSIPSIDPMTTLPCPFCGSPLEPTTVDVASKEDLIAASCRLCGAIAPAAHTLEEAMQRWNFRYPGTSLPSLPSLPS